MFKLKFIILITIMFGASAQAEFNFDFSRRTKELRQKDYAAPADAKKEKSVFEHIFASSSPIQELVLLNTEKGFVPAHVSLKQGQTYKLHVVNVNKKSRNVSFIMNSFSEHHATYYGRVKSFVIQPKQEGIFTFECPETSAQGRLVVVPTKGYDRPVTPEVMDIRSPASEEGE